VLARCANSEGLLITVLSNTYSLVAIRTRTFHDIYTVHVYRGNTGHVLFVYTFVSLCWSRGRAHVFRHARVSTRTYDFSASNGRACGRLQAAAA